MSCCLIYNLIYTSISLAGIPMAIITHPYPLTDDDKYVNNHKSQNIIIYDLWVHQTEEVDSLTIFARNSPPPPHSHMRHTLKFCIIIWVLYHPKFLVDHCTNKLWMRMFLKHLTIDPTANTVFHQKRAILPKTAHAQNEYSCDMFDKVILASVDIIHRRPQNSWFY